MAKPKLKPVAGGNYKIVMPEGFRGGEWDFSYQLNQSKDLEQQGQIEQACNMRLGAVQRFVDILPEDNEIALEWEEESSQDVLFLLNSSAVDHFLAGDFEMSASMLELSLELDPEDHLEATIMLAYNYVTLDEQELFDEIINDISDKYADKVILKMWSEMRRAGTIPDGEFIHFKKSFPHHYAEFSAAEHPVDDDYLHEIESSRPSREALARELWLRTENLWTLHPEFIAELKRL